MVWRVVHTYLPWSSNASMLTHIQHLHGSKKVWFHTFECGEKKLHQNLKEQALSTEKNYNIEKVQYEKEIDWKNKWKNFKKTSTTKFEKNFNETLKLNSMGCGLKEAQSWKEVLEN
jgi:hypothetical protein